MLRSSMLTVAAMTASVALAVWGCGEASVETGSTRSEKVGADQAGGGQSSPSADIEQPQQNRAEQPDHSLSDESTASEVTVRIADRAAYDELIRQHRGQVVLVDFWATWCAPCVAQFPHTFEMAEKYQKQGLAVVSVSLDDPESRDEVLEFLTKNHATFDNLLSQSGSDDAAFEAFEIEGGAIPHYKLYDRDGKLHKLFAVDPLAEKQFTAEDIETSIQTLLAAGQHDGRT